MLHFSRKSRHSPLDKKSISVILAVLVLILLIISLSAVVGVYGGNVKTAEQLICGCATSTQSTTTANTQSSGNDYAVTFQCVANCTQVEKNGTRIQTNWLATVVPVYHPGKYTFQESGAEISPYIFFSQPLRIAFMQAFINGTSGAPTRPTLAPEMVQINIYIVNSSFPFLGNSMQWGSLGDLQIVHLQLINATLSPSAVCNNFTISGEYALGHPGGSTMSCA